MEPLLRLSDFPAANSYRVVAFHVLTVTRPPGLFWSADLKNSLEDDLEHLRFPTRCSPHNFMQCDPFMSFSRWFSVRIVNGHLAVSSTAVPGTSPCLAGDNSFPWSGLVKRISTWSSAIHFYHQQGHPKKSVQQTVEQAEPFAETLAVPFDPIAGLLIVRKFLFSYSCMLLICLYSLEEILLDDGKLYLVFEFLSMDLKKYLDSLPSGQFMDKMLVKV